MSFCFGTGDSFMDAFASLLYVLDVVLGFDCCWLVFGKWEMADVLRGNWKTDGLINLNRPL